NMAYGLEKLRENTDTLIVIPNDKLLTVCPCPFEPAHYGVFVYAHCPRCAPYAALLYEHCH
ncbi:MAG: hypothetical protein EFT35_07150, partial [Methanophagales archaeon ANME-1-THS]